jgi:TPP-dependent pyruvate/acetoin dehydrogenase alpha subunit
MNRLLCLQKIDAEVKAEIDEATKFALESPWPELQETYTEIYIENVPVRAVELPNSYFPPGVEPRPI